MSTVVATSSQFATHIAGPWPSGRGPSDRLRVTLTAPTDSVTLCALVGEVDYYSADVFRSRLLESLETAGSVVVVDLSRVTFFGSAGLRVLIEAESLVGPPGGKLVLITGRRCVDRLLAAAGDVAVFRTVTSLAEVMADAA
ncbi:STAS domain-containing protein [Nocardia sp. NPDC057440]|uniref:STAS domain-containing protein n=1 Tax=Nocardia sp. NPDC057440 TaxID=3346134 RepID=UPI003672A5D5